MTPVQTAAKEAAIAGPPTTLAQGGTQTGTPPRFGPPVGISRARGSVRRRLDPAKVSVLERRGDGDLDRGLSLLLRQDPHVVAHQVRLLGLDVLAASLRTALPPDGAVEADELLGALGEVLHLVVEGRVAPGRLAAALGTIAACPRSFRVAAGDEGHV